MTAGRVAIAGRLRAPAMATGGPVRARRLGRPGPGWPAPHEERQVAAVDNALGIGVDLMAVDRMRRSIGSTAFLRATFTRAEQLLALDRTDAATYFAKVFAGKEAVFKSLGMSADALDSWLDIEILDGSTGAPEVTLHGSCAQAAAARGAHEVLLSMSHDGGYVLAACVIIGRHP